MRPIYDYEIRHFTPGLVEAAPFGWRDLAEGLALPLLFGAVYLGWPPVCGSGR